MPLSAVHCCTPSRCVFFPSAGKQAQMGRMRVNTVSAKGVVMAHQGLSSSPFFFRVSFACFYTKVRVYVPAHFWRKSEEMHVYLKQQNVCFILSAVSQNIRELICVICDVYNIHTSEGGTQVRSASFHQTLQFFVPQNLFNFASKPIPGRVAYCRQMKTKRRNTPHTRGRAD